MQDFRKIRAWQANREFTVLVYRLSGRFPKEERYGITAQIRSATISIGANIAEGCGRGSNADMIRFFQIAFGSAVEVLHYLITALDLGFIDEEEFANAEGQLLAIRRMIAAFMARVRRS